MSQKVQKSNGYRLSRSRSLAASLVATASLASVTGPRNFTFTYEYGTRTYAYDDIVSQSTNFVPPGKPNIIELRLGLQGEVSSAAGEYARRFALDPAALRISQAQVALAAQEIIKLDDAQVVKIRGLSSGEDDSKINGRRSGGVLEESDKNVELATVRGLVATSMLQQELERLGSDIKVEFDKGKEWNLTESEFEQVRKVVAPKIEDDVQASYVISQAIDSYNADRESVDAPTRVIFDKLLRDRRGAEINAQYYPSGTSVEQKQASCVTTRDIQKVTVTGEPAGQLNIPFIIPVPIPWLRRRRDDEPAREGGTISQRTLRRRARIAKNFEENYPVYAAKRVDLVRLFPNELNVANEIRESRDIRGAWIKLPLRLRFVRFAHRRALATGRLISPTGSLLTSVQKNALERERRALIVSSRPHPHLRKIAPAIIAVPIAALMVPVLKPMWYGPGVDSRGCVKVGWFPENGIVTKTPDECKAGQAVNAPITSTTQLPERQVATCVEQHPEAISRTVNVRVPGRTIR